jgi:hypothetical protein
LEFTRRKLEQLHKQYTQSKEAIALSAQDKFMHRKDVSLRFVNYGKYTTGEGHFHIESISEDHLFHCLPYWLLYLQLNSPRTSPENLELSCDEARQVVTRVEWTGG